MAVRARGSRNASLIRELPAGSRRRATRPRRQGRELSEVRRRNRGNRSGWRAITSPSAIRMQPMTIRTTFMGLVLRGGANQSAVAHKRQASIGKYPPGCGRARRVCRGQRFVLARRSWPPSALRRPRRPCPHHARLGGEALRPGGGDHPRGHGAVRLQLVIGRAIRTRSRAGSDRATQARRAALPSLTRPAAMRRRSAGTGPAGVLGSRWETTWRGCNCRRYR